MKYLILNILILGLIFSCSKSDDSITQNPYLPNYGFDTLSEINLSLPEYNNLAFPGNYIVKRNYGVNGFVLYHIGGGQYSCFELTDPNHTYNGCSSLSVEGIFATCGCPDENTYDFITGLPANGTEGQYTLKPYRIEVNGNIIRVYN